MSEFDLEHDRLAEDAYDLARFRAEALGAIDDEIVAVKACRRSGVLPVGAGRLLRKTLGRAYYYGFAPPSSRAGMREGREVGFEAGDMTATGTVVTVSDETLVLALDSDLGDQTPAGRVITDTVWLLRALQVRLAETTSAIRGPGGPSSFASAARVIGAGTLAVPGRPTEPCDLPSALNTEQRQLIELAQHAPASYLWGPGGTGKTETLAQLILSFARKGVRSLVTAPSNHSVDGLLERVVELARREPWWEEGAVLRLGPAESIGLNSGIRPDVYLDDIVARRIDVQALTSAEAYRREAGRLVARSLVLATTIHQTYLSPLLVDRAWDVLIVDEASMTSPAALFAAASLAERYVIAGDFRQLPPVVQARSVRAGTWLRRDPFEAVGIPDDIARGDYPDFLVMLRDQYRMAPAICGLVADAYDGQLRTHPSVLNRSPGPLGADGVLYIDSSGPQSRTEFEGQSRYNAFHAGLAAALFERMLERQALSRLELRDALVITPFVAQARVVDTYLRKRFGRFRPRVRTVHQSQGREADVVVLDLVDAPSARVSGFLAARDLTSEGGRLQTVAVTRARKNLVVLAHFQYLLYDGAAGPVARALLEKVATTGRRIGLGALLRGSLAA